MPELLHKILLIIVVIGLFNLIIFVHELGHFLAARWRGLQVDRFQVWFGKPIWKKEINGVQYGLGWLPFGGFVALPQMVTMETVEGSNLDEKPLPPVSPLDKMIVAFAGPLFSLLLAVIAGFAVTALGKPEDAIKSNVIGAVVKDGPADKAGLKAGDHILKVDGEPVDWFAGRPFYDITTRIMLTEGDSVTFEVERDGKVLPPIESKFEIEETPIFKRRALPQVGIAPSTPAIIGELITDKNGVKSPAELAGLKVGDEIVAVNGTQVYSKPGVGILLEENEWKESELTVKRGEELLKFSITPLKPLSDFYDDPMIGVGWDPASFYTTEIVHPSPWQQIRESMHSMWVTIKAVSSPKSNIGVDQLAGPIGIAKTKFQMLLLPDGWLRVLAFFVFFNINLAILNMLPLPVLDGGHIVMAIYEWIRGKALPLRFLEVVQSGFALLLIGFMLYITTKDIGDSVPGKTKKGDHEIVWPVAKS